MLQAAAEILMGQLGKERGSRSACRIDHGMRASAPASNKVVQASGSQMLLWCIPRHCLADRLGLGNDGLPRRHGADVSAFR